ncbi:reticulon-4-interacting protein 1 homolog, mitochondrial isoform X2 [Culicoides brevitarsis]|uniref:reticulon-4-interacting protein 1 homolog, mitochondrial isoform X2 n=1 Tax=Culicoides brevitarsis TaxID=469753 RepID=UPI00307CAAA7
MNSLTKALKRAKFGANRCSFATISAQKQQERRKKVREWHILRYGTLDELVYRDDSKKPQIKEANEVMIKVNAASVNPIDVAMIRGYGSNFLNLTRKLVNNTEFPLVVGRDFVGEVVQKGMNVPEREARVGQQVWGVMPVHKQGCHRDFIVLNKNYLTEKPSNLPDTDVTGFLYAGMTAWSGIYVSGNLGGPFGIAGSGGGKGKKVLVLGASGGVGSIATQILLAEGANVTVTCSSDALPFVQSLGNIPNIVDYKSPHYEQDLKSMGTFDLVLDCAGKGPDHAKDLPCPFYTYVTFSSPTLRNTDEMGLIAGNVKNLADLIKSNVEAIGAKKGIVKWAYFLPAPQGLTYLRKLVNEGRLSSVTTAIFPFEKADLAYKRVEERHLRGKVVLDFTGKTIEPQLTDFYFKENASEVENENQKQ